MLSKFNGEIKIVTKIILAVDLSVHINYSCKIVSVWVFFLSVHIKIWICFCQ